MPLVTLQNVPRDPDKLFAFLSTSLRNITDAIQRSADSVGSKNIEITDSSAGVILTAPNGTRYLISVDNAGTLSTTAL